MKLPHITTKLSLPNYLGVLGEALLSGGATVYPDKACYYGRRVLLIRFPGALSRCISHMHSKSQFEIIKNTKEESKGVVNLCGACWARTNAKNTNHMVLQNMYRQRHETDKPPAKGHGVDVSSGPKRP